MKPFNRIKPIIWIKVLVFALALIPVARLTVGLFTGGLGANPVEFITHTTGTSALVFLMITLAVTPLRKITVTPVSSGCAACWACSPSSTPACTFPPS